MTVLPSARSISGLVAAPSGVLPVHRKRRAVTPTIDDDGVEILNHVGPEMVELDEEGVSSLGL